MVAVGVVLGGASDADLDVGNAAVALGGTGDGTVLGADADAFGVGYGIADEVGARLLDGVGAAFSGAEGGHGAVEFGAHGFDEGDVRTRFDGTGGDDVWWGDESQSYEAGESAA